MKTEHRKTTGNVLYLPAFADTGKEVNAMTENEKNLLQRWMEAFQRLPPNDKERTLAFVEGAAFQADKTREWQTVPEGIRATV